MREHLHLYVPSLAGVVLALWLWVALSRALHRRDRTRWRAVPLCLSLLLASATYGLFWFGFFSSPSTAVQLHAVRLTITYFVGPYLPMMSPVWLLVSGILLLPLLRKT